MAKDDFRRDENTYFGIPIETTEQLDEIRKALKSIEPLVSKLRDDFRAEKGNEKSRSNSLKDGLSKVSFGIKDVEDLLRDGKAVDEKTVLKLFKTPIQDIFKDVSASQLILEKKGKERGFEFTERDLETLMKKSVKLASTVLTRVPKFGGQRPSEFKQSLNKTIEAQNELVFKKRMDAIQAEQDRIEELKKQDAKNRIAEEDLKRAEKAKVDADNKQRRLENKKSSVGVVSDEEKSALKSNREKYIKCLADYDEKLATFNKTQSELEKNLKTANRVVKEAMETDRIFSQDLRPIGDFGHILQRMFKRYIKYEEREEIQQETDLGKTILFKLVEAITAQYGFLPTPMDLASKDLYFNKEKDIKLINSLGEVLESAKEIMKSPIHPGRRPVNPHIRRGWADDKLSRKDQALLKVFNSENRKQAVEEYEQELDKELREEKENQIDDEEIVEAIEDFVEAVVEAKEAIADLSESNKSVSEVVDKTLKTIQRTADNIQDVVVEFTNNSVETLVSEIIKTDKPRGGGKIDSTQASSSLIDAILSLRSAIISLNSNITRLRGSIKSTSAVTSGGRSTTQPSTTTPGGTTPGGTTPGGTTPGGTTPGGTTPGGTTPGGTTPGGTTPGGTTPGGTTPGGTTPGGTTPIQPLPTDPWGRFKRWGQLQKSSYQWGRYGAIISRSNRWQASQKQKGNPNPPWQPPPLTRFRMWAGDQAKRGASVAKSVGSTAVNIGNTAYGGSMLEGLTKNSKLAGGILNISKGMSAGGMAGAGIAAGIAGGVGLIIMLLKKILESSPILKAVLELFNLGMTLFFMPFGNMLGEWLLPLMMDFIGLMVNWNIFMSDLPAKLGEWFSNLPGKLLEVFVSVFNSLLQIKQILNDAILSGLTWLWDSLVSFLKWWFIELPLSIGRIIYDGIKWLVDSLVNTIKGIFGLGEGGALEGVGNTVGNVVGAITGFLGFAAEGGYVPARPGGTPIIVGEGGKGEYIVPEGSAIKAAIGNISGGTDGASVTVNISGNVYGVDDLERTIKRAVDDSINKSRFR